MDEPVAACNAPRAEVVPEVEAFMLLFHIGCCGCVMRFSAVVSEIPDSLNRYLKAQASARKDPRSNQDSRLPQHVGEGERAAHGIHDCDPNQRP